MRRLIKPLLLISLALAVPILPFVLVGEQLERNLDYWVREGGDSTTVFLLVTGMLAVDVFLPIPSSGIGTVAGAKLGTVWGAIAIWLGMTTGAIFGFAVAWVWGRPLAERLASPDELERLQQPAARFDTWLLVLTRPLPILAEATVLLLGAMRTPWRAFVWPVVAANLVIAVFYAACGELAQKHDWLAPAVVITLVVPLLIAWVIRKRLRARH